MQRILTHFGEPMRESQWGLRLTRETYAFLEKKRTSTPPRDWPKMWEAEAPLFEDEAHTLYRDENVQWMFDRAMRNFDLNMEFCKRLDATEFEDALQERLQRTKFMKPVSDLREVDGVTGMYMLVLDQYHQAYIGQAGDIRRRIKQHWTNRKRLDRLVFGSEFESVLSIDSFRPMDTTRIFAGATKATDHWEERMVDKFPDKFLLNRIGGGRGSMAAVLQENRRTFTV